MERAFQVQPVAMAILCFIFATTLLGQAHVHGMDIRTKAAPAPLGTPAKKGEFPWRVRLAFEDVYTCSGALVYPDWVLAPKSCFEKYPQVHEVTAYLGGVKYGDYTQSYAGEILPADYNTHPHLVLVKLKKKCTYDSNVMDILLPPKRFMKDFKYETATVSGWNSTGVYTHLISYKAYIIPDSAKCGPMVTSGTTTAKPTYNENGYEYVCASSWNWKATPGVNDTTVDFMDYQEEYSKRYYIVGVRSSKLYPCGADGKDQLCCRYASVDSSSLDWMKSTKARWDYAMGKRR